MRNLRRSSLLVVLVTLSSVTPLPSVELGQAQDSPFDSKKIVPFVPSPQEVVDRMIELASVKKGDLVYDMGSGDGRIVIAAAKKALRPSASRSMAIW